MHDLNIYQVKFELESPNPRGVTESKGLSDPRIQVLISSNQQSHWGVRNEIMFMHIKLHKYT